MSKNSNTKSIKTNISCLHIGCIKMAFTNPYTQHPQSKIGPNWDCALMDIFFTHCDISSNVWYVVTNAMPVFCNCINSTAQNQYKAQQQLTGVSLSKTLIIHQDKDLDMMRVHNVNKVTTKWHFSTGLNRAMSILPQPHETVTASFHQKMQAHDRPRHFSLTINSQPYSVKRNPAAVRRGVQG